MKTTALLICALLLQYVAFTQNVTVTGTVRSASDNAPLSGVSISASGTSRGTTTNKDGKYSIVVAKDARLAFSFLGFISQQVPLDGRTEINIQLQPGTSTELGAVVVTTALGIKKQQKTLGYAVQEVSGETMAKTKTATVMSALTGKVAGLNITNTTDLFRNPGISLRGRTPLVVIDGIPDPDADPYKVNADDIESISVLKGTAAAALYGSMGINGAIMYTTKKAIKES
ncbi:TonB-dependent receptor plug domain-containing protein [Paraflavitalea speifideaquila]|uniref:TonB-dependent receptor plug domain-containing protein n=1 Tax=Paraflavitalea speifideaquila TaxID=3076558 RepID=UPI0028E8F620|nr:TonB-dependent receptor plug domain-containing protein [Paraflavitalea speifideiaquila]